MNERIKKAYNSASPDQTAEVRIYEKIVSRSAAAKTNFGRAVSRKSIVVAAAVISIVALMITTGYAAFKHWTLPEPTTFELGDNGYYQEKERNEYNYSQPDNTTTANSNEETDNNVETLDDKAFIQKSLEILKKVGMLDVDPDKLTVTRQDNLFFGQEEAEVSFEQDSIDTSVKFNAKTGRFLGMDGIDWQLDGTAACNSDSEAEALARRFYENLPVEQGYTLTHLEKYDNQYWSYDFCREVEPRIYNQYEMVRIAINPVSGRLTGCNVFYVPLLDDHEQGQQKITQEEADQIVQSKLNVIDGMSLEKAEVVIGLPNWNYTEYPANSNRRISNVTRWAWSLTYEKSNGEFDEKVTILVDCYTGEILGGDATK